MFDVPTLNRNLHPAKHFHPGAPDIATGAPVSDPARTRKSR
jgi:hypothetical protein